MAAPTYISNAVQGGLLGADLTVSVPTGTQNGDLMLAYGVCAAGTGISTHASWTAHPLSFGAQAPLFYRWASSEPANYTMVTSGAGNSMIRVASYRGVDPSAPFDDVDSLAGATGAIALPSCTINGPDRLLVQLVAKLGNTTFTNPGTATERWDAGAPSSNYANAGGDEIIGAGATGTRTWTPAAGTAGSVGYILALAPIPDSSSGFLSLL